MEHYKFIIMAQLKKLVVEEVKMFGREVVMCGLYIKINVMLEIKFLKFLVRFRNVLNMYN